MSQGWVELISGGLQISVENVNIEELQKEIFSPILKSKNFKKNYF